MSLLQKLLVGGVIIYLKRDENYSRLSALRELESSRLTSLYRFLTGGKAIQEAVTRGVLYKKLFLKLTQYSQ